MKSGALVDDAYERFHRIRSLIRLLIAAIEILEDHEDE